MTATTTHFTVATANANTITPLRGVYNRYLRLLADPYPYRPQFAVAVNSKTKMNNEDGILEDGEMEACDADGLEQYAVRTQEEVAQMLGISRQAVQQTERRALLKIRKALLPYFQDIGAIERKGTKAASKRKSNMEAAERVYQGRISQSDEPNENVNNENEN